MTEITELLNPAEDLPNTKDCSTSDHSTPAPTGCCGPIPDHIPRQHIELTTGDDACADCGGKLRRLGEDVTEELEYVPGRFIVNRITRPRFACSGCDHFTQAQLPSRPIERGRPGPGLLAHVLVSKYADHLPLYRQSRIFERDGLDLDRSTLADWVGKFSKSESHGAGGATGRCHRTTCASRSGIVCR